jgi:hypothetical protein
MDGSTALGSGTLNTSGIATFTTSSPLTLGTHSITAVYNGDNNFSGSTSSPVVQTVASLAQLTSSAATSAANSTVSFTATVVGNATNTPTGTITFMDGSTALGPPVALTPTGVANTSVARLTVELSTIGTHAITAVFTSGDTNFPNSTSNTLTQTVTAAAPTGTWSSLNNSQNGPANGNTSALMLLSDGTVMAQDGNNNNQSANWYRLTPDATGSYVNGTWSQLPSMNVSRLFFPSAMLSNGDVFVVGGEYSSGTLTQAQANSANNGNTQVYGFTNTAEVYDPTQGAWTLVAPAQTSTTPLTQAGTSPPPTAQPQFGDDPIEVLSDGTVLAGYFNGGTTYLYNPATNSWTNTAGSKLPASAGDASDEETWVKLPDGSILSYSIFSSMNASTFQAQRYIPASQMWVNASTLNTSNPQSAPLLLSDGPAATPLEGAELGPAFLLPENGQVIYFGANGNTAYYDPSSGIWTGGPAEPTRMMSNGTYVRLAATDDPGAVLPNGDILLTLSPLVTSPNFTQGTPAFVYEYNPVTQTFTDVTPGGATTGGQTINQSAFQLNMVVLPSGQVLMGNSSGSVQIYTESATSAPQSAWQPVITNITGGGNGTFTLTGTQLNGLDDGATYGDDDESASNYPIIQLTNTSGSVYYARTSNWSSTGVATGSASETVTFTLPASLPPGTYNLAVIANGIPSASWSFTVGPVNVTSQVSVSQSGLVYNRATQLFGGTITITNTGSASFIGTLEFEVTGLPAGITLANASGTAPDGNPYILISLPNGIFAPGQSITFSIYFKDPNKISFNYGFIIWVPDTINGSN